MSRRNTTDVESSGLYSTPYWATSLIVQQLELPRGRWVEPCCGEGAIIRAVDEVAPPASWTAIELDPKHAEQTRLKTRAVVHVGDALSLLPSLGRFDVSIGNPPFPAAVEIVSAALAAADHVLSLQRLDWLEGERRRAFFVAQPPDVWVLPNRPLFGDRQDSGGYAWFYWPPPALRQREAGLVRWLPAAPLYVRSSRAKMQVPLRLDGAG